MEEKGEQYQMTERFLDEDYEHAHLDVTPGQPGGSQHIDLPVLHGTLGPSVLDIRKKVTLKNASFDLFINGSNVLDEDARPQNSPLKYIAPLPGRAFQLGITMHI